MRMSNSCSVYYCGLSVVLLLFVQGIYANSEQEYLQQRANLVSLEYEMSLSGVPVLNSQEKIADGILSQLLVKEAGVMGDYYPPSINFFQAHGWIDNTSILFPLVKNMPKGVIHHVHFDSSATYDWFIQNITYSPNCYIYEGTTDTAPGALQVFAKPPNADWVPVNEQRAQSGNVTAFDEALLISLTMQNEDFGDYVNLWRKFDMIFERVSGLISYKDAFEGFMQHMVSQMLADGVQNIEIKIEPELVLYDLAGNNYDFDYVVKFMYGLINATQQIEPQFTLKMIMSDSRHDNYTTLLPLLKLSLEYRNKYPDLVMGFDLVGPEDEGYPLIYFLDDFLEIANISQSYQYSLPYYFHAGETLDANNTNLFDAIMLGCYRIGHAFQLAKHPLLTNLVKSNDIGLEICPISNQLLLYIHDLRGHPAYNYFDEGLLITISPDDPAIYGYGGVSYDWYEILLGWSIDIAGLKQLAMNSYIKGSFATEQERAECMAAWATKWDAWIEWVISTYSDDVSTN